MKINPTLSLFCSLLITFILGFSISSNFKFPYEVNQSLDVLLDDISPINQEDYNPGPVSSEQINEDFNNIDTEPDIANEESKETSEINKNDISILPESDGAEFNFTAFCNHVSYNMCVNFSNRWRNHK